MFKLTAGIGALVASLALAGTASAAVTFNSSTGTGFVGKGDVQIAYGWNNTSLQKNATGVTFTSRQAATQALSSTATQAATQSGTQVGVQALVQTGTQVGTQEMTETLSCIKLTGNRIQHVRYGTRDGTRDGTRSGTRDGSRDGSRDGTRTGSRSGRRAGVIAGSIASVLDGDPRQTKGQNQFTGFILKGFKVAPAFVATGDAVWNAPTFDGGYTFADWSASDFGEYAYDEEPMFDVAYTFETGYTFGATTWSTDGWDAEPNADPDVCLRADGTIGPNIVPDSVESTITDGAVTDGAVTDGNIAYGAVTDGAITPGDTTDGAISYGSTVNGAVTATGAVQLFANYGGVAKLLTFTPVL
jgi:hypothetical protein